jgi:hypothetical protein
MDEFFARNRLSAYLDGELPSAEAREVEDALAQSPTLRAELDDLRGTIALLRAGGPIAAPRGFAQRLEARLEREPNAAGWRRHLRGVRLEAVVLAAAAAVVLVFAARRPDTPDVPVAEDAGPVAAAEPPPVAAAPELDVAGVPGVDAAKSAAKPTPPKDALGTSANGVLGDEGFARRAAKMEKAQKLAQENALTKKPSTPTPSRGGSSFEKEPYAPAWEKQEADDVAPTVYAPAQFTYRLRPTSERGLEDLAALARSLGGSLVDAKGKPVAPYPMNPGDTKTVRLMLPSVSAGDLAKRLSELGAVETVSTSERTAYAPGTLVPVIVEVTQP